MKADATTGRPRVKALLRHPVTSAVVVFGLLATLPMSTLSIPVIFDGAFDTPGVGQLIAVCLVFGGLAIGYDLMFGTTGLLSFGHGLFVTTGMYVTTVLVDHVGFGLWTAAAAALGTGLVASVVLGAVALRVPGIGFAMVTLAFGQAVSIAVLSGSPRTTGGEQGLTLDPAAVPASLAGVLNTRNLYWVALAYLVACATVVWWMRTSVPGRVMRGVRDNEVRVVALGLDPYRFKLLAFVVAGLLASAGGVIYLLLIGSATPNVSTSDFTLSLLVMVVLGGAGRRWGAIIGGIVYAYASQSLTRLSGSHSVQALPAVIRGPIGQPLFLLGLAFVLIVLFAPGGLAALRLPLRLPLRQRRTATVPPQA